MQVPWLLLVTLTLGCNACGASSSGSRPAPPAPTPTGATQADPVAPTTPEASDDVAIARTVDPAGHAHVEVSVARGPRTFALVRHDLWTAANDAIDARPDADAVFEAWDGIFGACLGGEVLRCAAAYAPEPAMLASASTERAFGWSVVALESGRIVARRPLVALSVHDPEGGGVRPAMHVEDVDDDGRVELLVDVPFDPLRDDAAWTTGDEESGAVTYLLDASLSVQARFTSQWSWAERLDDGDSPPRSTSCFASETFAHDGALELTQTCDGEEREARCPYDPASDRYACPAGFASELFEPYRRAMPHYVGETYDDLRNQLPMLGTEVDELYRRAAALPAEP